MDINRALRTVVATGKVYIGSDQTAKAVKKGEAKLVILAANNPHGAAILESSNRKGIPVYEFPGKGTELGPACGKPFPVGVLAVVDAGESDILQLAKGR